MAVTSDCAETVIHVAGTQVHVLQGGSGPPLLTLHGAGGSQGWLQYHRALAEHFTVYAPSHPGYGPSERPEWLDTMTDMAHFYQAFIDTMGVDRLALIGTSMGGWLAAEMAAMCPERLSRMVLVDAVGIKPEVGEIADILMCSREDAAKLRFYDTSQVPDYETRFNRELTPEERDAQYANQEMATRLCWRPYMHNPKLPYYLRRVQIPTLVVWGRQDAIVPLNCGEIYARELPNARLHVIDNCGHSPHNERPDAFLQAVMPFLMAT
jgi:pimeloyl-ACP methyl ester carboxylesterase